MLVVRQQERVGREVAPVDQEGPAVLEEGQPGAERQQQRRGSGESEAQQDRRDEERVSARNVYGRSRPPVNLTNAFQALFGRMSAPASKRPTESQKLQDSGRSFQENQ